MWNDSTCIITDNENEALISSQINVFPNPTEGFIEISGLLEAVKSYRITNSLGQVFNVGDLTSRLDISFLPSGIYTLNIKTETTSFNKTFMKK